MSTVLQAKDDNLVNALFGLLSDYAYRDVTLMMIAERAGLSMAALRRDISGKFDILERFAGQIDEAVLAGLDPEMGQEGAHERLFDVLMRRFDALQPHREAVRALRDATREDVGFALALWRLTTRSQRWMMAAADLGVYGGRGEIAARGLAVSFARLIDVWLEDDDPGLARTMAALDRALRRGERAMRAIDTIHQVTAPFRLLLGRAIETRRRRRMRAADERDDVMSETRH